MIINPYAFGGGGGGGPTDPYFANVKALLHFDGADGSTTMTDVIGNTWTAQGNAQLDTAQTKYGPSALLLDGATDYVTSTVAGYAPGTGDFTTECWFRIPSTNANNGIFALGLAGTHSGAVGVACFGAGSLQVQNNNTANSATATIPTNAWHHIVVQRASGTLVCAVDGVSVYSVADTRNITATQLAVGGYYSSAFTLNGWIDDFRHTVGVARYSFPFTPSASPWLDS